MAFVGTINSDVHFRNRIINGAMSIDQRKAGASVTPTDQAYTLDRWSQFLSQTSKLTIQQNAGSVTPPAGFTNYLGVTSSSAYSITSSDFFNLYQLIEGYNVADLNWGTANAKTVTLSFWVRSSLTGTFGGALQNSANNRSYPFTYTINSANTWEFETITIPGDTSGTWLTTNGVGLRVFFGLGLGSNLTGPAGAWAGSAYYGANGSTSVVGTNGATFYITGVQLEEGSVATPFERRPHGLELQLCQRYYFSPLKTNTGTQSVTYQITYLAGSGSSGWTVFQVPFPVAMRVAPTLTHNISDSNNRNDGAPSGSQWAFYVQNQGYASKQGSENANVFNASSSLNHCQVGAYYVSPTGSPSGIIIGSNLTFEFSAEL
jgi:hypothetical protein